MLSGTERFYAFERAARAHFERDVRDMSLAECERLANLALCESGALGEVVEITDGAGRTTGGCTFCGTHYELAFPPGRRRPWCVLHEVAHVLADRDVWLRERKPRAKDHGPVFVRHCLRLWTTLGAWTEAELLPIARCHLKMEEVEAWL